MTDKHIMTTAGLRKLKGERPIAAVTAYDTPTAALADAAGVDLILVGDSVGTTVLGWETTVPVTIDIMVHHCAAVSRANPKALLVADLPFGYGGCCEEKVIEAAIRLMQEGGARAVKLEGGAEVETLVRKLGSLGIAVMGHIGLLPQRVHQIGGYRKYGKTPAEKQSLLEDARALERAGVFAIVGEMIDSDCSSEISQSISVPLIGIGSGAKCDGQILVAHDLLGLTQGRVPSFAREFVAAGALIRQGFQTYTTEVREGRFPS